MDFEFDPKKSESNLAKHGISFLEAMALWEDEYLVELKAKGINEKRFLMIGKIGNRYWSAITTLRGHTIRIISVRRSRKKEIELYESK